MRDDDQIRITDKGLQALAEAQRANLSEWRVVFRQYLDFYAPGLTAQQVDDYLNEHTYDEMRKFHMNYLAFSGHVTSSVISSLKVLQS